MNKSFKVTVTQKSGITGERIENATYTVRAVNKTQAMTKAREVAAASDRIVTGFIQITF